MSNPFSTNGGLTVLRLFVLFAAVILLASGCRSWTPNPNRTSANIGWFQDANTAERAALRRLSVMLARSPGAPRYQVVYAYDGTHFGGEVPHIWDYNPQTGNLQDTFEASREVRGRLRNVTPADIHRFAKHSGTFSRLEAYLKRKGPDRN